MTEANTSDKTKWLGLREAGRILGVHAATVRIWTDRGLLPSQRTVGGHRRILRSDLDEFIKAKSVGDDAEARVLIRNAVGRTRLEIGEGQLDEFEWFRQLDDKARTELRTLGRRLMDVLGQHLVSIIDQNLEEVRDIGLAYGKTLRDQGLTLSESIEGFFMFNDFIVDAIRRLTDFSRVGADRNDGVRKIYGYTREVVLALVDAYAGVGPA
jgi:excisionase family DNA binding protein